MAYKAHVESDEGKGAWRTDDNCALAISEAVVGSGTITPEAFLIGVIAWAIVESHVEGDDEMRLLEFLRSAQIPMNMRKIVFLAVGEDVELQS